MGILGGGYDLAAPISILTLTPLHAGSGRSLGTVDLPIQRDGFGYPVVWGSSFKGALRAALSTLEKAKSECINLFFGNPIDSVESYAGSVYISDLHPVTISGPCSVGGCYYTSPRLLLYLNSLLEIVLTLKPVKNINKNKLNFIKEKISKILDEVLSYGSDKVIVSSPLLSATSLVGFAGTYIKKESILEVSKLSELFFEIFKDHYPDSVAEFMANKVVLLPEDSARVLFRSRLLIRVTRVALDYKTKTVKRRALWSEEYIPNESLLAGVFLFAKPRSIENAKSCNIKNNTAEDVAENLFRSLGVNNGTFHLIIGGHETIGKGLVRVTLLGGGST